MNRPIDSGYDLSRYVKEPIVMSWETPSEEVLKTIIDESEYQIIKMDLAGPRVIGGRSDICHRFTRSVKEETSRIRVGFIPLYAPIYQVFNVHKKFGRGKDVANGSFGHLFNVTIVKGTPYLIDLTIGQFVSPSTGRVSQSRFPGSGIIRSGNIDDYPFVHQLVADGYMPLNDQNFQDYLRFTTGARDKSYIDAVTVQDFITDIDLLRKSNP